MLQLPLRLLQREPEQVREAGREAGAQGASLALGREGRGRWWGTGQQIPGSPEDRAQGEGEEEWVQWTRREQEEEGGQEPRGVLGRGQEPLWPLPPLLIGWGLVGCGLVGRGLIGRGL